MAADPKGNDAGSLLKEVHEKRPLDHEKKPFENLEVEDSHPMSWLARVRFGSCLA